MRFLPSFLLPKQEDSDSEVEVVYGRRTGGRKRAPPYIQRSSHADIRDYLPYHQQRLRSSWCDKTYPEFQATLEEHTVRKTINNYQEFLQVRVDEMNRDRMELGLPPWKFHPMNAVENLTYWYGLRGDAMLRYGHADKEEEEIAEARAKRRNAMEEMEDETGSLVGLLRKTLRGNGSKPSVLREILANFKLLFNFERSKNWVKHKSMVELIAILKFTFPEFPFYEQMKAWR
ncbi:hypothetical protein K435DRAFT_961864 [Dendrothele bispora CBS 962.96]|uniref:Uncharacterized protein n=1 Tax=Dendrothele bispora (strain CBS 962.96) TaxID=1314807 RepID=A0A4V4HBL9_DENBC|nr:hypothetical protein K435DRAFT_845318 [Dendrothele bispora CBS 962.96]THV04555.1 hypothetical protein K435DRAFT_961864 [Dendrothele bispora CBS 962.96]